MSNDAWKCSYCDKTFPTKSLAELHEVANHMRERVSHAKMKGRGVIKCAHCGSTAHSTAKCWKK